MLPATLTMTYPLVNSMQQKQNQNLTQPLTFKRPNPPTPEAVAKAQFVDKTYRWAGK